MKQKANKLLSVVEKKKNMCSTRDMSWRSAVMAGCIIMSQTECHPHSHQCPVSQWEVWQGGEVLQKSKKNQKRVINKADAIWNLIYSVPGSKMKSEKVCAFKMG